MTTQLPIPKERLKEIAEDGFVAHGEIKAMARALLAACEQEPVAWRYRTTDIHGNHNPRWSFSEEASLLGLYKPLYDHPAPQQSLPDVIDALVDEVLAVDTIASTSAIKALFRSKTGGMRLDNAASAPQGDFDFERYNDIVWLDAVASQPAVHGVTAATVATLAIELNKRLDAAVLSIPAVQEERTWLFYCEKYPEMPMGDAIIRAVEWNACRAAMLSAAPTVSDGWIPVSERMPLTPSADCEYSDIEVSVFDGERVFTAHYAVGSLPQPWGDWVDTYANITHWQPLPDAPKVTP